MSEYPKFEILSEKPSEETVVDQESASLERAQEIAGQGNYEAIHKELEEQHLLERYTQHMKELYSGYFGTKDFSLEERSWEMLAILYLYDEPTLQHSLRTFDIAHEMVTQKLYEPKSGEEVHLGEAIQQEGVNLEQFLNAALFHDIGKVTVPREILNNSLTGYDMGCILMRMMREGKCQELFDEIGIEYTPGTDDENAALKNLHKKGFRSIEIVPLSEVFPETEYPNLLQDFESRGFSKQQSLKSVLDTHEMQSAEILKNDTIVAELAGHHHNYKEEPSKLTLSIAAIRANIQMTEIDDLDTEMTEIDDPQTYDIAMMHLITIADITDALRDTTRPYKGGKKFSEPEIFVNLIRTVGQAEYGEGFVHLWISNKYPAYKESLQNKEVQQTERDIECCEIIESFLEKQQDPSKK